MFELNPGSVAQLSEFTRYLRVGLVGLSAVLLITGCSTAPESLPTEAGENQGQESSVEIEDRPVVTGLDQGPGIILLGDPWELVEQANNAPADEAPRLLIRAINDFLDRGQTSTAQSITEQLETYALVPNERLSLNLIRARISSQTGRPETALGIVNTFNLNQIGDPEITRQILVVKYEAELALGQLDSATATLLVLDTYLSGYEQVNNQLKIIQQLQTMDAMQQSLLRGKTVNSNLAGWLELTALISTIDPDQIDADLAAWRNRFPTHPLQDDVVDRLIGVAAQTHYRQVALLLPLTSAYGTAAQAFYEGFAQAHARDLRFQRPEIVLYDIGEEADLTALYYHAAIADGADMVVGPLGRKASENLLTNWVSETDTLVIANVPEHNTAANLFGISLSPEAEARQVADKAWADGHRQATVFRVDSPWGQRVALAFVKQWQSLGGVIVKNRGFEKAGADYSENIQRFLGLDKSVSRYRLIEAKAGTRLKFTPRRNEDMDFIFLAGNSDQARLVVPQLRFFQAHNLPIYATSYIYGGKPQPGVDADLDGVKFGEMKWMLDGVEIYRRQVTPKAAQKTAALSVSEPLIDDELAVEETDQTDQPLQRPYLGSSLDRLYALGVQSYEILPRLNGLRSSGWQQYRGSAMTISVAKTGEVIQHPIWVEFQKGLPSALLPDKTALGDIVEGEPIQVSE